MFDPDKKYFGSWWVFLSVLVIGTMVVSTGLRWLSTTSERAIFEASYQRSSAESAKQTMLEAELAAIDSLLSTNELSAEGRADANAQRAGIIVQLGAMK